MEQASSGLFHFVVVCLLLLLFFGRGEGNMDEGEPKSKSPGEEAPMLAPMIKRRCVVKVNSYWRNLGVIYKKKTK